MRNPRNTTNLKNTHTHTHKWRQTQAGDREWVGKEKDHPPDLGENRHFYS